MSNAVIPANITIPAHVANRLTKSSSSTVLGTAISGGINVSGAPRISIRGGRFRIVEEGSESVLPDLYLNVVIVGANPRLSKIFYEKQYSPDSEPSVPDCYSFDGLRPHVGVPSPQNDICAGCPQNAWGSRTTPQGVAIKACADQKRLAVVAAGGAQLDDTIYLVQIPPASLKNLNAYQRDLSRRGIPPEVVITKLGFDTDASHPKLTFEFGGFMTEEQQGRADTLFGSPAVVEVTGEADVPVGAIPAQPAALPTPAAPVQLAALTPAPAVVIKPAAPKAAPAAPSKFGSGGGAPSQSYTAPMPPNVEQARPAARPSQAVPPRAQPAQTAPATSELGTLEEEVAKLLNSMPADDAA